MPSGKKWNPSHVSMVGGRDRYNSRRLVIATWRRHFVGRLWSSGSSPKDIQVWILHNMPSHVPSSLSVIRRDIKFVQAEYERLGACPTCGRGGYVRPADLVNIKERPEPKSDDVLVPGKKRKK